MANADVEGVLGKFVAQPRIGRSAGNTRADSEGAACVYSIAGRNGRPLEVAVQIDPTGSAAAEQAATTLDGMIAAELSDGTHPPAPSNKPPSGWDYVGGLPDMRVWRRGHLAVAIGGGANFLLPAQKLDDLAAMFRDRIPDIPMAQPGADSNAPDSGPDPCSLLLRTEAESVMGRLLTDPYRSAKGSPLADGAGESCTYYTEGHRALVLTPVRSDGRAMFEMQGGASGLIRSVTGGADVGDAFDGPWDQATEGSTGSLYFLKGDRMLEITYRTADVDAGGAARLARVAIARL